MKGRGSRSREEARVYVYLLSDRVLTRVKEVWSFDIT